MQVIKYYKLNSRHAIICYNITLNSFSDNRRYLYTFTNVVSKYKCPNIVCLSRFTHINRSWCLFVVLFCLLKSFVLFQSCWIILCKKLFPWEQPYHNLACNTNTNDNVQQVMSWCCCFHINFLSSTFLW